VAAVSAPLAPKATAEPHRATLTGLFMLTFVTGVVDAASVLGLGHVFTANMTGNVVFLGFALAGRGEVRVDASVCALASFLLGSVLGGRLSAPAVGRGLRAGLAVEVSLLALAAVVTALGAHTFVAVALLAFAMGLRNAVIRKLAIPDLTTTVLTLTITGLGADSSLAGGVNPRWARRALSVVCMLAGAGLGAALLGPGMGYVLAAAALVEGVAVALLLATYR